METQQGGQRSPGCAALSTILTGSLSTRQETNPTPLAARIRRFWSLTDSLSCGRGEASDLGLLFVALLDSLV